MAAISPRHFHLLVLVALAVGALALAGDLPDRREGAPGPIDPIVLPDRYIVTFRDGVDPDAGAAALAITHNFKVDHKYRSAVLGFSARLNPATAAALRADPRVRYVEQDRLVSVDVEELPTGIDRIDAEPAGDINGTSPDMDVDIAIIDTGIQTTHPDLRVVGGFASYGFVIFIFEFCGETDSFEDGHGHGTHVAGTAAAKDDATGVVGVAPGARLWAVRVLGPEGTGCLSDVIAGVDWVTQNAATIEVANMSIESENSPTLCTAIANSVAAGVTYAVAAGNSGINAQNTTPANCPDAITVSAVADYNGAPGGGAAPTCQNLGADDTLAGFSNYGAVVDIAAPGVCIQSTYIGSGYTTFSGTSMASPHVAGGVARFIVDTGYAGSPNGAAVVAAMTAAGWTEPQGGVCGFSGDPDAFAEPMLHPGAVCEPGPPPPTPTPTNTPTITPTPSETPSPTWTPGGPTMTPSQTPTPTNTHTATPTFTPSPTPIPMSAQGISAGGEHSCALTSAGGVRCWGRNFWGELGDGTNINRNAPVDVGGLSSGVVAVSAGGDHTCALLASGGVTCWGRNDFGQLGDGTMNARNTPGAVPGLSSGVAAISGGGLHTCALMSDATVKCWGKNDRGQVGDGSSVNRLSPVNVGGLTNVMQVDAGGSDNQGGSTCARTSTGGAKCWGRNDFGQLGDGTTADRSTPVEVSGLSSGVDSVGVGRYHSCARILAGDVKCWGWNIGGQLGNGSNNSSSTPLDVVNLGGGTTALSVGGMHSCAILSSTGARCWGYNSSAQIGDGTIGNNRQSPVDVLQSPGGAPFTGVTAIAAGGLLSTDAHTCAITTTSTVCWGLNSAGELGDGTNTTRTTPTDVVGMQPAPTPTPAPPLTATPTPTPTPTFTPTWTPTAVPTATPTNTPAAPATDTPVPAATNTPAPVPSATPTPTFTATPTPTDTPTPAPSATPTPTFTATPTPTDTPTPTPSATPTPTFTATPTPTNTPTPAPVLYFTLQDDGAAGSLIAANEDIIAWHGGATFTTLFDGGDVGLAAFGIDAFSRIGANEILISFTAPGAIPGIAGTVDDSDVVRFTATSLGETTAGAFSLYFDGSDVGLTTTAEDVDVVELLPNGHLLISTGGAFGVPGVSGNDEDLIEFTPTSLGATTAGTWAMYFDGSDVGLELSGEDVDAAAVAASGAIYLSTLGTFAVTGASGFNEDVLVFTPSSLGNTTAGTFSAALFFDGSVHGLAANNVYAIDLP